MMKSPGLRTLLLLAILLAVPALAVLARGFDRNAFEDMFGEPVTISATGQPQRASEVSIDFGFARNYGDAIVAGNSSLSRAEVQNYELDYDRTLPIISSLLRMAAFAQHMDSTTGSPFGSGFAVLPTEPALLAARGFASSSEAGGETGVMASTAGALRCNLSHALAAVRDNTRQDALASAATVSLQCQTPTNSTISGAGYTWRYLDLDMQARWQLRIQDFAHDIANDSSPVVTGPDYVTISLRAAWRLSGGFIVSALADQANKQQPGETAGLETDRQFLAELELRL